MRGDSGVAGEWRVVGVPNFHSWGKCTMPLTNINSDWMSNTSSGLCVILFIYMGPLFASWGVNKLAIPEKLSLVCCCWHCGTYVSCTYVTILTVTNS